MNTRINQTLTLIAALCLASFNFVTFGQDRRVAYEDWYGDVKKILADHYVGKTVKLRMAIPATRRGLELFDGTPDSQNTASSMEAVAQSGDELTIKSFKVRDTDIELMLSKADEKRSKNKFFSWPKKPRISLRFSRELTVKDLTIEAINGWLAQTMDVTPLTTESASSAQASVAPPVSTPKEVPAKLVGASSLMENSHGLPTPIITGDLVKTPDGLAELTVESSVGSARVYIDDAYSGYAPRAVKLRPGVHSILVMADGYRAWEQKLFVPGSKTSIVKAEFQK